MSIRVTSRVWENSNARGGERLVLLAIADRANDEGWAWPGIDSLARKTRLTPRHVTRCLNNLKDAEEIIIKDNRGPKGTNLYQVLCFPKPDDLTSSGRECQGDKRVSQMSPESSEPSVVPTHTIGVKASNKNSGTGPSEEEVIQHARIYPGNTANNIPPGISETWATNYWTWRTYDQEHWPKRWREEMFRRYEKEWKEERPAARGILKKNPALRSSAVTNGSVPPPPGTAIVDLKAMRS
jgi:hypothetical protein